MAFAHAALEPAELGPVAGKFVGAEAPAKMRKMAAAGLAPLPPRDMLVALYQLWTANDETSDQAGKTVEGLPAAVLDGALADARLPPGVLDLLGRKHARNEAVLSKVVRHPGVHDQTLIGVARVCPESICDVLADNETRWLACPAIVTSLYNNRHCRMSVVHRMIELAERQEVELQLPAMDEIRQALADSGPVDESRDRMFSEVHETDKALEAEQKALDLLGAAAVEDDLELPEFEDPEAELFEGTLPDEEPSEDQPGAREQDKPPPSKERRLQAILQMRPLEKIRTAMLGDKYDRSILVRDSNKTVAMATIKSPKIRDDEAVVYAANRALSLEVISYISNRRDWIKLYSVKLNLVMNPKTPMARSMTLLAHLNQMDVQKVARSKNIPSALATAAKRKLQARR
ncbi:MAG TPA: hypothetical protein VK034_30545 [Enhygromyxa sp.]|nr:hypothetical protein [Enhygromyxa sp.]